ncbi:hypothetical protein FRC01_014531 [Tulasnella sp. 417]|nr:hypothetical protein FRC01_014531 [Tulasnella sp. 417]
MNTKYPDRKANANRGRAPLSRAVRNVQQKSERKTKRSVDSTSQQGSPSKPDASKTRISSTGSESPAQGRSHDSEELLSKTGPSVSPSKQSQVHDATSSKREPLSPDPAYPSLFPDRSLPSKALDPQALGYPCVTQPNNQDNGPSAPACNPDSAYRLETIEEDSPSAADAAFHELAYFGVLQCVGDPTNSIPLRVLSNETEWTELIVGADPTKCDVVVNGDDVDGNQVRFGDGPWFKYRAPKCFDLYEIQNLIYDDDKINFNPARVKRLSDEKLFVVKTFQKESINMATTQLSVFKALGHHPHITRFIEGFYDRREGIHRKIFASSLELSILTVPAQHADIIFEASQGNLFEYVQKMRARRQGVLADQAQQMFQEISSAIAHIHAHKIVHRNVKPENILIFAVEPGIISLKVCNFDLACFDAQPIPIEGWLAGTEYWAPPHSFLIDPEDGRAIDCYGIGRILQFLLTSSPWPTESRQPDSKCGCEEVCSGRCEQRTLAFKVLEHAGVGRDCIDLLTNLLVGYPDECLTAAEVMAHPYVAKAIPRLTIE